MNDSEESLLKEYRELQLRVTRFSAIEQELINTRDRLDHELILYKRLQGFTQRAIQNINLFEFITLLLESIIDIVEVESSFIYIDHSAENAEGELFQEGISLDVIRKAHYRSVFKQLLKRIGAKQAVVLHAEKDGETLPEELQTCICFRIEIPEHGFSCLLAGAITKKNAPLYQEIKNKHNTIFEILCNQTETLYTNRLYGEELQKTKAELQKLSLIATQTGNSVIITNRFGEVEWVNKAFTRTTGYSLEEIAGRKPKDFLRRMPGQADEEKILTEHLSQKKEVELTVVNLNKSGNPYYNRLQITPVYDQAGHLTNFISIQRDITREVLYQKENDSIRNFFEAVLAHAPAEIMVVDSQGKLLFYNRTRETGLWGLESRNSLESTLLQHSEQSPCIERLLEHIREAEKSSGSIQYEELFRSTDGSEKNTMISVQPYTDEKGAENSIYFIVTLVEISEIKKIEKTVIRNNEELRKINSELDNFVYSVSHDLRSPLLSIKGIITLIFHAYDVSSDVEKYLRMVESSINKLDGNIREILEYSRNSRLEVKHEKMNLESTINSIFQEVKYSVDSHVLLEMAFEGESEVFSDRSRLTTVLKNLISNSIRYRRKDIEAPFVKVSVKQEPEMLLIKVSDNGVGIPKEQREKVFEMFYRGNSASSGTGLGLYIVKEIVNKMDGRVVLDSEPGKGTAITISLPIHHDTYISL
jgi:PAS domain S-box-containing protein